MKAYYINLARRTDRRATMEVQLARLGLGGERIEAVLAADLPDDLRRRYLPGGQHRRLSVQEFCCGVSHLDACRALLASADRFALVLEDDIVLSPHLPAFLNAFERSPQDIDLLRIETFASPAQISTRPLEHLDGHAFHTMHGWAWGAAAYIISRRAAAALVADPGALEEVIDRVIYRPHRSIMGSVTRRQLVPALAIQQDRLPGQTRGLGSDLAAIRAGMQQQPPPRTLRQRIEDFVENEIRIALPARLHRLLGRSHKVDIAFRDS